MPDQPTQNIAVGAIAGAAWAAWGWANNAAKGERKIRFAYALKTIVIGAVAGAIVGSQGDALNIENIEAMMVFVVPFADKAVNTLLELMGSEPIATPPSNSIPDDDTPRDDESDSSPRTASSEDSDSTHEDEY